MSSGAASVRGEIRPQGRMTATMRAVQASYRDLRPRVLRLARVEHGRVIDERIHRGEVTIGDDPRAALFAEGAPHLLFAPDADAFVLHLPAGARARVALADGAIEVRGQTLVRLDAHARGKLFVGDAVFLFQVVAAPPPAMRAALPSAVLRGAGTDWRFVIVAAASFLAHFGFAGAVQADFFDPHVDDESELVALVTHSKLRPEIQLEEKIEISATKTSGAETKVEPTSTGSSKMAGPMTKPTPSSDGPALGRSLDGLDLKLLGALGKHGPAQSSILRPGAAPADAVLDELAKTKNGVETNGSPLKDGGAAGGPIAGGKPAFGGGETKTGPAPAPSKLNELAMPAPPPHDAQVSPAQGAAPKDVNSVIARYRWKFRACYGKELAKNPDAHGTIRVRVEVSAEGDVLSGTTTSSDFSPSMNACIEAAFRGMHFGADDQKSVFAVPILHQHGK